MEVAFTIVLDYRHPLFLFHSVYSSMENHQLPNVRLNSPVDLALKDHLLVTTSI